MKFSSRLIIAISIFLLFNNFAFSASYKITNVVYELSGLTKESSLSRKVEIDKTTIFDTEEQFLKYINQLKTALSNTRNFDNINISYTFSEPVDDICNVTLNIQTKDSFHFLVVPYPKYSTSDGFSLKLKIKDTNFLGSMNTLNSSIDFSFTQSNKLESGLSFSFYYPFKRKPNQKYQISWTNNLSFGFSFDTMEPKWDINTGILWSLPIKKSTIKIQFTQGFTRNLDYLWADDDIYLSENLEISYPIEIAKTKQGKIFLNPYINFNYKFDPFTPNGYSGFKYNGLKGPVLSGGATVSFSKINWTGNYRNGFSFSAGPSMSYNFASITHPAISEYSFGLNANVKAYKSFNEIGFYARMWAFAFIHDVGRISGYNRIDGYLRGVVDYRKSEYKKSLYQAQTPTALVFNFDMPIHVITADWTKVPGIRKIPFMKYLNFELQFSPFIDIALIETTVAWHGYARTFDLRDGFYTAGFEFIVFPQKWKGIEIRASIGWDVGLLLYGPILETSWRNKTSMGKNILKSAEIFIGIGLQY